MYLDVQDSYNGFAKVVVGRKNKNLVLKKHVTLIPF